MRNILLTLAYDGTEFVGWQRQKNGRSVQEVLEQGLSRQHKRSVTVQASGRTDSGVHATGQRANFHTDLDAIPPATFAVAINSFLPPDVRCVESREVPTEFHARYDAKRRTYEYRLSFGDHALPHRRRYVWLLRKRPKVASLNRMAATIVGTHDFAAFAAPSDATKTTVRHVYGACFYPVGDELVFRITGSGFLWRMVRSLVGTMIGLENSGKDWQDMGSCLESCDRGRAGITAPSYGLFLTRVEYEL